MNGQPGLTDDELRDLLEKRAGRPDVAGRLAAVRSVAAATRQRRVRWFGMGVPPMPTLVGAAGVAAVVLVVAVIGLAPRSPSSGTPTGSPRAASGSPSPNLSPLPSSASGPIVLTVDQLNGLIATNPAALNGRVLVIDGVINGIGSLCTVGLLGLGGHCLAPNAYLDRSNPKLDVVPLSALGPGPWSGGADPPIAEAFAATLVNGSELDYMGPVTTSQAIGALLPSQLPALSGASPVGTGYWLVHGWISGLGVVPSCPSIPAPASTSQLQYSCGGLGALLADDARQPVTVTSSGFSVNGGSGAVELQNGAYQAFAPAPESNGAQTRPEEGTFLVQETSAVPCLGPQSCAPVAGHWAVVARVDPLPAVVTPPASSPTPSVSPQPIRPLTVAQADAVFSRIHGPLQVVITGTIGRDPPNSGCRLTPAACSAQVLLLGSYAPLFAVYPIVGGASLPSHLPFTGTFAAQMDVDSILSYEGLVTTAPDGTAILPSQLPARTAAAADPGELWLVKGWIAGLEAALPCPIAPGTSQTGPQYGCGSTASLSDTDSQPVSDLQLKVPADGIQVQNDAYNNFAPEPQSIGFDSLPEQATFLVHAVPVNSCPGAEFCPLNQVQYHWAIVARIDPWPLPALP